MGTVMAPVVKTVGRLWGAGLVCLPLGSRVLWVIKGSSFWRGFGVHCAVGFDEMQGQCSVVHGLPERTPRDESVCCAAMLPLPRQWVEGMAQRRVDTGAHSTRLETR